MITEKQFIERSEDTGKVHGLQSAVPRQPQQKSQPGPRIALLTPYTGGNLGDAAIQDAIIANLRIRMPGAQFSGISLNCDNFVERHGASAFPLCAIGRSFYHMSYGSLDGQLVSEEPSESTAQDGVRHVAAVIKNTLKTAPVLKRLLKKVGVWITTIPLEIRHCIRGYKFLHKHDVLFVSGGGQLDEEWGGPWAHPFALFKWAVLARIARVPCGVVSVGACKLNSKTSRTFLSATLRMARYKSYRDRNSREIATTLLPSAAQDPVVPDLAFSLQVSHLATTVDVRKIPQRRPVIGISPIAFAKPGSWPQEDRALYNRYLSQIADVISKLLKSDHFIVIVWSSEDDRDVIRELLERLDDESKTKLAGQVRVPPLLAWKDFIASLQDVDLLIASRLHGAILGLVTHKPIVAISFDPKVDWLMEDIGQTEYLLQIRDFTAKDVVNALDRIQNRRTAVLEEIASYQDRISSVFASQYDALAKLAMGSSAV